MIGIAIPFDRQYEQSDITRDVDTLESAVLAAE
jgi:hypothetical protein